MATKGWEEPRGIEAGPIRSYDFPHPINETIFLVDGVGEFAIWFSGVSNTQFFQI